MCPRGWVLLLRALSPRLLLLPQPGRCKYRRSQCRCCLPGRCQGRRRWFASRRRSGLSGECSCRPRQRCPTINRRHVCRRKLRSRFRLGALLRRPGARLRRRGRSQALSRSLGPILASWRALRPAPLGPMLLGPRAEAVRPRARPRRCGFHHESEHGRTR
jgi:hypothetical protein